MDNFLIPAFENWFDDDDDDEEDDYSFCHRVKGIKAFLQERHIKSITTSEQSGAKSNEKFKLKIFENGPCDVSIQQRSITCHSRKLDPLSLKNITLNYWNPSQKKSRLSVIKAWRGGN